MAKKEKEEEIPYGNSFQDTSGRYPNDQKLRTWGFKIERRPKYGQPVWSYRSETKTGIEIIYYQEDEALQIISEWEQEYGAQHL